ncbi:MAG: extracellular solute-binding protein [Clostridia bacterium]|nr:extracellular solute-binding protein [Clostridia bacterium]
MKKFLVTLLALIMLASNAFALEIAAPGTLPLVDEPVQLTMMIQKHAMVTDYTDNYLTKLIKEVTGVELVIETLPTDGSEAKQKFSLMVAGGQKLPDILVLSLNDTEKLDYGSSGYFLPMNDWLENDAYYWNLAMDTYAADEKELVLKYATSADGNIYGYPSYYSDPGDNSALGMWINKTWCDNLGLEIPTTTEELYNVLKAFKENDANGNGDVNDEIPLIGHAGWMGDVRTQLMNAFIYDAWSGDFGWQLNVNDGILSAPFVTEEWHEGLRYLAKLYAEGLLSPLSFSQSQNELKAILSAPNDQATLVGAFVGHPSPLFGSDGSVDRVQEYVAVPAMVGPEGVQWSPYKLAKPTCKTYITADCENPELAFRVLDAIAREDLSLTMRYGEQNIDWEYTTEGEIRHKYLEGFTAIYGQPATSRTPWTTENAIIWNDNSFNMLPPKLFAGLAGEPYPEGNRRYQMDTLWYSSVPLRHSKHPENLAFGLIKTQDEIDLVADIETSLQSYVNEAMSNFILGNKNVETDWDAYLTELNAIGLDVYVETMQGAYDRMFK